mmetsp:Transcript_33407/g.67937  ORF Transcript_33407/g.67937 Transcript_33407/m.67937 type:complete len:137 (+) Transcript_33407:265-675(+)
MCCQGSHLDDCKSGTSRWRVFESKSSSSWIHNATIEDSVSADAAAGGCADGFTTYDYVDSDATRKVLATCFGGLCIVDVESGVVVSRMWTQKEQGGCRVSNIVLGKEYAFITGSCGVLTLPLTQRQSNKDAIRTEL